MSDFQSPGQGPWDAVPPSEQPPTPPPYPSGPGAFSDAQTQPYGAPAGSFPPPGAYPPPGYGQPGYGAQPYGQPYGPVGMVPPTFLPTTTNGMSIAALVCGICGFLCVPTLLGIIFGFVGLSQIGRTNQRGRGMAIAGIVCSIAWLVLLLISAATGHVYIHSGTDSSSN